MSVVLALLLQTSALPAPDQRMLANAIVAYDVITTVDDEHHPDRCKFSAWRKMPTGKLPTSGEACRDFLQSKRRVIFKLQAPHVPFAFTVMEGPPPS